tara:strand:- start:41 stop:274 length:234 start_codon:yes stop_codon:yes gene_type:complete
MSINEFKDYFREEIELFYEIEKDEHNHWWLEDNDIDGYSKNLYERWRSGSVILNKRRNLEGITVNGLPLCEYLGENE